MMTMFYDLTHYKLTSTSTIFDTATITLLRYLVWVLYESGDYSRAAFTNFIRICKGKGFKKSHAVYNSNYASQLQLTVISFLMSDHLPTKRYIHDTSNPLPRYLLPVTSHATRPPCPKKCQIWLTALSERVLYSRLLPSHMRQTIMFIAILQL